MYVHVAGNDNVLCVFLVNALFFIINSYIFHIPYIEDRLTYEKKNIINPLLDHKIFETYNSLYIF